MPLKDRLAHVPRGAGALFFIQIFATLGFAVLYSTLVLYATQHLGFSTKHAAAVMGMFGAFNYGLHLFGGYLGGRFLSNRNLFVGGMVLQAAGCAVIAAGTTDALHWGLALFLTGSGLNVTCLNMMLTQRFTPEDDRREGAFLWNYAGMNVGFFVGFLVAGHYQLVSDYGSLFVFATVGNVLAIIIALANWRVLADLDTPLLKATPRGFKLRLAAGSAILLGLVPVVWAFLLHPDTAGGILKAFCALVAVGLIYITVVHPVPDEQSNMKAYLILALGSLVFWTLYQMAPNGLQLFALNNVDRIVWGVEIAPQWIQNINTVVIVIGGPVLAALFVRLRAKGHTVDVPRQFAVSLILMGVGFLALPLGIAFAGPDGRVAFGWLALNYVLQSLGELLISPIGYAMIGRMAPRQYQGVMMGSWMLVSGLASLFAGDFSGMIPEPGEGAALSTNPAYASLFAKLGTGSLVVGVGLALLTPYLRALIGRKHAPRAE